MAETVKNPSAVQTSVLIVGGGAIGLALAANLGRRGAKTLLIEQRENKLSPAKMLEVSVRTVEFCRQLGIVDKVRNWGFPPDWPLDSVFVTDMRGYELGRIRSRRWRGDRGPDDALAMIDTVRGAARGSLHGGLRTQRTKSSNKRNARCGSAVLQFQDG